MKINSQNRPGRIKIDFKNPPGRMKINAQNQPSRIKIDSHNPPGRMKLFMMSLN